MSNSLDAYLILSGILFSIGTFGFLARRNAISMLMSIELMLNAVNLAIVAFAAFGAFGATAEGVSRGSVIALMVISVAAAEATVGLAIIIAVVIALSVTATDWGELPQRVRLATNELSRILFTDPGNLLPFEVIGVLLLAAVIGGVFLAKREPGGPS